MSYGIGNYTVGGAGMNPFGLPGPQQGPMGAAMPQLPMPGPSAAEMAYKAEVEKAIAGQREQYKPDPYETLLNFGLATMAASSQPGANALGAIGQGGLSAVQNNRFARREFLQDKALEGQDRMQRIGLLGQLVAGEKPQYQLDRNGNVLQMNGPLGPRRVLDGQAQQPLTPEGKLKADLDAGRITQEQFNTGTTTLRRSSMAPMEQNAIAAGLTPGTPEFQRFVRDAVMKPQTEVKLPTQENAEAKREGERLVDEFSAVADRANNAQSELNNLRIARTIAVNTQLPSELQSVAGRVASSLGLPVDSPTIKSLLGDQNAAQSFVGVVQNLVLTKMQAQKGPQTENDAKRIERTVASLGNTPAAREFLLRTAEELAQKDIAQRNFYEDWRAEKGTYNGAARAWRVENAQIPLVGANKNSGLPVFFSEYERAMTQANPGVDRATIIKEWKAKYE